MNTTYHPLQSQRSHHYGNHQMHQMAPYGPVHHSGTYTPTQNQYHPSTQDLYRNHHPAYAGVSTNHSMPAKSAAWGENNTPSADVIQSYNQMPPQPQMMNTSQMPVSTMRSPPQAMPLNINATQPPVPQHYRQLQSPNDSSHSWPQMQAPSPGVLHSSRTTPSPLSAHVRSPGISQPFSPTSVTHHSPAPMNVQQHSSSSVVPENDQCSTLGNVSCESASNPLHSLQKMVMLDQELKPNLIQVTCEMSESCDQSSNQSSAQNISEEQQVIGTESKDSLYSTYLTLGENCLESQAEMITSETVSSSSVLSSSPPLNCNPPDLVKLQDAQGSGNDTSQTATLAASAESENICTTFERPSPSVNTGTEPSSQTLERLQDSTSEVNVIPVSGSECSAVDASHKPSTSVSEMQNLNVPDSSENLLETNKISQEEASAQVPGSNVSNKGPSIVKLSAEVSNLNKTEDSSDKSEVSEKEVSCDASVENVATEASKKINKSPKRNLRRCNAGVNYEEAPSPEPVSKPDPIPNVMETKQGQSSLKKPKEAENVDQTCLKKLVSSGDTSKKEEPASKAPVKVVIHRIRKSNTDDTWHVPNSSDPSLTSSGGGQQNGISCTEGKNDPPKASNIGPQIIILSSAMSKKKFGITGSSDSSSVITIDEDNTVIERVEEKTETLETGNAPKKKLIQRSPRKTENSPKKKGKATGSKARPSPSKKGKGKKVSKKRKKEPVETEVIPKIKKSKIFNGPYVHITGSKESPLSITVVNVAPREEEKDQKNQKPKRDFTNTANSIQRKHRVGHSSTLSPSYDAFNKDKTWVCAFCHNGSHHQGLGDLYGPYYIIDSKENKAITSESSPSEKRVTSPSTPQVSNRGMRSKRKRSDLVDDYIKSTVSKKRQSKRSGPNVVPATSSAESTPSATVETPIKIEPEISMSPETEKFKEVWVHEDCFVWCHGVSLMGQQLHGLEEAIRDAVQNKCSSCKLVGATLGCRSKACTEQYHFGCAKEKGCEMDIDVFSLLCPKHLRKEL